MEQCRIISPAISMLGVFSRAVRMKSLSIAVVVLLATWSVFAAESTAQIRLGAPAHIKAPPGSATAGSTWIEFSVSVTNITKRSIWFHGYSLSSPFYSLFTRQINSANWTDRGVGFCGTGAGIFELPAGAATSFTVAVPERYVGEQLRVELAVLASPKDLKGISVSSEAASIK